MYQSEFSVILFLVFAFLFMYILVKLGASLIELHESKSKTKGQHKKITNKEREIIIREVVMVPCLYCGNLMPQTATTCPNCGAKRKRDP